MNGLKTFRNKTYKNVWVLISLVSIVSLMAFMIFPLSTKRNLRAWMDVRIQADLGAFAEISIKELDAAERVFLEKKLPFVRVKIVNGRVSSTNPEMEKQYTDRIVGYLRYLEKIQKSDGLPDADLIIALDDGFDEQILEGINAPIFCISKAKSQTKVVAIPAMYLYPDHYKRFSKVSKRASQLPWEDKIEVAFWRGSTTGAFYTLENWMHSLRTRLVLYAERLPETLDCAFAGVVQSSYEVGIAMKSRGLFKEASSPKSQVQYKYLIAIDGNTCASSLKWQLFSNSVVLKNESDWIEWYDTALIPYQHYIPFQADLSDLLEKIEWLKQNDNAARKIAQEAQLFVQQNFTSGGVELYIRKLLFAYSALLKLQSTK
jgi:hypothetical protein